VVANVDDGLDDDDSLDYDDNGLNKEEATEKGPGARADGMTTAGPKADMETCSCGRHHREGQGGQGHER
jgi:hypothetical protein